MLRGENFINADKLIGEAGCEKARIDDYMLSKKPKELWHASMILDSYNRKKDEITFEGTDDCGIVRIKQSLTKEYEYKILNRIKKTL
jgi:hypothetical protein